MSYRYSASSRQGKRERKRGGKSTKSLASQVAKNTAALAKVEVKTTRTEFVVGPSTTTTVTDVTQLVEGVGEGQRIGRTVQAFSISARGSCEGHPTAPNNKIRFMLVRDNLGSGTPPTLSNLFEGEADYHDNEHKRDDVGTNVRFTVLWDKYIILNENYDGQQQAKAWKFYKKLNHKVTYSGAGATDEGKGSIFLYQGSNEASNVPTVTGDVIFKYTDI